MDSRTGTNANVYMARGIDSNSVLPFRRFWLAGTHKGPVCMVS